MYERIMTERRHWGAHEYLVLSADMRTTLDRFDTMNEAKAFLEQQVKLEKSQCPSGVCEE